MGVVEFVTSHSWHAFMDPQYSPVLFSYTLDHTIVYYVELFEWNYYSGIIITIFICNLFKK